MNLPTSHDILQEAADDAKLAYEENLNRKPTMRASRAGQPLLVLAMEDFIIPKLPTIENSKPAKLEKRVSQNISVSMGYLFEKALLKVMRDDPSYSNLELITQQKLDYKGITGTADLLVKDNEKGTIQVIECKSLNVEQKREAEETKLSVDNWGYLTQLALYHASANELFPELTVKSAWKVYAKKSGMVFTVPLRVDWKQIVAKAVSRAEAYNTFRQAFEAKDIDGCLDVLLDYYDPLPVKGYYYGRLAASCGFHFNPWSNAILDEDGLLREGVEKRLHALLLHSFYPTEVSDDALKKILQLLDNR